MQSSIGRLPSGPCRTARTRSRQRGLDEHEPIREHHTKRVVSGELLEVADGLSRDVGGRHHLAVSHEHQAIQTEAVQDERAVRCDEELLVVACQVLDPAQQLVQARV